MISRRGFLGGLFAAGAGAVVAPKTAIAALLRVPATEAVPIVGAALSLSAVDDAFKAVYSSVEPYPLIPSVVCLRNK